MLIDHFLVWMSNDTAATKFHRLIRNTPPSPDPSDGRHWVDLVEGRWLGCDDVAEVLDNGLGRRTYVSEIE